MLVLWDSLWDAVELLHCDELHVFNLAPWGLPELLLLLWSRIHFCLLAGSCCLSSEKTIRLLERSTDIQLFHHNIYSSFIIVMILYRICRRYSWWPVRVCELTEMPAVLLCKACVLECSLIGAVHSAHLPGRTCPGPTVENRMKHMSGAKFTFTV